MSTPGSARLLTPARVSVLGGTPVAAAATHSVPYEDLKLLTR